MSKQLKPKSKGRSPDYDLSFKDKRTEEKGRVGAAWGNEDGSISIVLNPRVVIEASPNLLLTLFLKEPAQEQHNVDNFDLET